MQSCCGAHAFYFHFGMTSRDPSHLKFWMRSYRRSEGKIWSSRVLTHERARLQVRAAREDPAEDRTARTFGD